MARLRFFYDVVCPYAYLASTQVEKIAGAHELVWEPFLLGGVFRHLGAPDVPGAVMSKNKSRLNDMDMERWAKWFDVPFAHPAEHPRRSVLAMRAVLAADDRVAATRALYRAYWVHDVDIASPAEVARVLTEAGLDGATLVERASDPAIKDDLRARTQRAFELGIFGAPAFIIEEADKPSVLFWGQDRLTFVERALGGWRPRVDDPTIARVMDAAQ